MNGFYAHICGHKYNGKVFQCDECKAKQKAQEEPKTLNGDDHDVMFKALSYLESSTGLTDREHKLKHKLHSIINL